MKILVNDTFHKFKEIAPCGQKIRYFYAILQDSTKRPQIGVLNNEQLAFITFTL